MPRRRPDVDDVRALRSLVLERDEGTDRVPRGGAEASVGRASSITRVIDSLPSSPAMTSARLVPNTRLSSASSGRAP